MSKSNNKRPLHILIIGSLPPPIGGASVSLQSLIDKLRTDPEVHIDIINTTSPRQKVGFFEDIYRAIHLIRAIAMQVRHVDIISLHTGSAKICFTGTITLLLSKFFHKPLIIRKFGGTDYNDFPLYKKIITKPIISLCDMYLVQTKYLVNVGFKDGIRHCRWFPTSRQVNPTRDFSTHRRNKSCRRFVYAGHVREYKGIREMIQAMGRFDDRISLDVYGPFFEDLPKNIFVNCKRVRYCGTLKPEEVASTMQQYDALVLPTKSESEGYPGAILEAYSVGLPVVATTCGAIPEIVDETTGILVEPGDAEALYHGMKKICDDMQLYVRLRKNARERANQFSIEYWGKKFVEYCQQVYKTH